MKEITIYLKSGKHLIFKNIKELNVFANNITFRLAWTGDVKPIKDPFVNIMDFAGYMVKEV